MTTGDLHYSKLSYKVTEHWSPRTNEKGKITLKGSLGKAKFIFLIDSLDKKKKEKENR